MLLQLEQYDQAKDSFQKATKIDPYYIDAWFGQGLAFEKLNNTNKSITCYNKIIKLDPKNSEAHYKKGLSLVDSKKDKDAILSFENALKINTKNLGAWYNLYLVFNKLKMTKKSQEAYKEYQKIISI